jgi:hypothetical protein
MQRLKQFDIVSPSIGTFLFQPLTALDIEQQNNYICL